MNKKLLCLTTAMAMTFAMTMPTFAAELTEDGDSGNTTITTSIDPTFIVTIPEDTEIDFGETSTEIGSIALTQAQLDPSYYVRVSASAGEFTNDADSTKTIPYNLVGENGDVFSSIQFDKKDDSLALTVEITEDDWNAAYAGDYTGIITFTVAYDNAY